MANRMDPSGQRFLMSACVGRFRTLRPSRAAPGGTAWPNVAQPGVRATVAIGGDCAAGAMPIDVHANRPAASADRYDSFARATREARMFGFDMAGELGNRLASARVYAGLYFLDDITRRGRVL